MLLRRRSQLECLTLRANKRVACTDITVRLFTVISPMGLIVSVGFLFGAVERHGHRGGYDRSLRYLKQQTHQHLPPATRTERL